MKPNIQEVTQEKRISETLIFQILHKHDTGQTIEEIWKRYAIKEAQFYHWRDRYWPERYSVHQKPGCFEIELNQYEVAPLLQAEQIRILNEIVHNKFID